MFGCQVALQVKWFLFIHCDIIIFHEGAQVQRFLFSCCLSTMKRPAACNDGPDGLPDDVTDATVRPPLAKVLRPVHAGGLGGNPRDWWTSGYYTKNECHEHLHVRDWNSLNAWHVKHANRFIRRINTNGIDYDYVFVYAQHMRDKLIAKRTVSSIAVPVNDTLTFIASAP